MVNPNIKVYVSMVKSESEVTNKNRGQLDLMDHFFFYIVIIDIISLKLPPPENQYLVYNFFLNINLMMKSLKIHKYGYCNFYFMLKTSFKNKSRKNPEILIVHSMFIINVKVLQYK